MTPYRLEDLTFEVDDDGGALYLIALHNGREVGHLTVTYDTYGEANAQVGGIESTAGRGARVGTRLYEFAARYFCEQHGIPLSSDISRSKKAEGFWRKQFDKGRANFYRQPRRSEDDNARFGAPDIERAHPDYTSKRDYVSWYTLKTCPPPANLDGLRRRR